jgi:hypothetical protein
MAHLRRARDFFPLRQLCRNLMQATKRGPSGPSNAEKVKAGVVLY